MVTENMLEERLAEYLTDELLQRIGDNFKLLRTAAGWGSGELAEKLGSTRQWVHSIESKRKNFSKMHCLAYMKLLDERGKEKPEVKYVLEALKRMPGSDK